jgi:ABC-2 type transport system permease protein
MLRELGVATVKELRVVLRDRAGFAILFAMPVVFVVIMSLALQDFFREGATPHLSLVVLDGDRGQTASAIGDALAALPFFDTDRRTADDWSAEERRLRDDVVRARTRFAVLLPPGFTARHAEILAKLKPEALLDPPEAARIPVTVLADPAVRADHRALAESAIQRVLFGVEMQAVFALHAKVDPLMLKVSPTANVGLLAIEGATGAAGAAGPPRPTSTQQNVPAYILLAMFMLVVPLSGTFIREREQGSLARLRSMPVSPAVIVGGKVVPYLAIHLAQVAVCLAIGIWLLPVLGGDALALGRSPAGIVVLALAASIAAIGFALLVALSARTIEQATAFGAAAVLIFAALGGVMVPKTVMPESMAALGRWSPLGWALDGFLDLFVRDATLADVLPRAAALLAFGCGCFALALVHFRALLAAR